MKKNIKDYNLDELKQVIVDLGEKPYRAEQIFKWIFVENVTLKSIVDKETNTKANTPIPITFCLKFNSLIIFSKFIVNLPPLKLFLLFSL